MTKSVLFLVALDYPTAQTIEDCLRSVSIVTKMVLLTHATISALISGIVICLFTLLLFLSGYILQQQTVKSLQDALRAPIELRLQPRVYAPAQVEAFAVPTLTPHEATVDPDFTKDSVGSDKDSSQVVSFDNLLSSPIARPVSPTEDTQMLWRRYISSLATSGTGFVRDTQDVVSKRRPFNPDVLRQNLRLAYFLPVSTSASLCSALLFAKQHRTGSQLTGTLAQPNIVVLYPLDWDRSSNPAHRTALKTLVNFEQEHAILLHPCPISKVWSGVSVESQLLAEVTRSIWTCDRALYLPMPSIATNLDSLDESMLNTLNRASMDSNWSRPRSQVRGAFEGHSILLYARGRGLMVPTGNRRQTVPLGSSIELADETTALLTTEDSEGMIRKDLPPELKSFVDMWHIGRNSVCTITDSLSIH